MKVIEGNLVLKENTTFAEDLKVKGNIVCEGGDWDLNCLNLNCEDLNCRNLNCRDLDCCNKDNNVLRVADIIKKNINLKEAEEKLKQ